VTERGDRFGGLEGYLQQVAGGPHRVPSRRPEFAGAKTAPTAPVPVPPIKSSAATPGAKSNSVIPYPRVTPSNSVFNAAKPGHLSFVAAEATVPTNRKRSGYPERHNVCGSIEVVNNLLTPTGTADDSRRVLAFDPMNPFTSPHPLDDWRQVQVLREWRLDGVVLGIDSEENASPLVNVAIGGIARQVVNVFGAAPFALEDLFVGLIATLDSGNNRYTFEYVPFCGRLLDAAVTPQWPNSGSHPMLATGPGMNPDGSARSDATRIERMVGAWRLGRVTDTASVKFKQAPPPEHNVSVLLAIEWWDWRMLRRKYPSANVGNDHLNRELLVECGIVFNWPSETPTEGPHNPEGEDVITGEDRTRLGLDELDKCPVECVYPYATAHKGLLRSGVTQSMFADTVTKFRTFFEDDARVQAFEDLKIELGNLIMNNAPRGDAEMRLKELYRDDIYEYKALLNANEDMKKVALYLWPALRLYTATSEWPGAETSLQALPNRCKQHAIEILIGIRRWNDKLQQLRVMNTTVGKLP